MSGASTGIALYVTTDAGNTWVRYGVGLPSVDAGAGSWAPAGRTLTTTISPPGSWPAFCAP